jgi:hypothetical protein
LAWYASGVNIANRVPAFPSLAIATVVVSIGCSEAHDKAGRAEQPGARTGANDAGIRSDAGEGAPRPIPDVVADFLKARSSSDAAERTVLLNAAFAADGVYTDPMQTVDHREGLAATIVALQNDIPGATISTTTRVDLIRGRFRYGWQIVATDGTVRRTGEDVGAVGSNGKIQRIDAFFDPPATNATPTGLKALIDALAAPNGDALGNGLKSAITDEAVWTDRSAQTTGVQDLVAHLVYLLSPGSGTKFELAGYLDAYGNVFRARVSVAGGYAAQYGQLFGHATTDGRLDTIEYFDSELSN